MTCFRFFLPALFVLSAVGQSQNAADPSHITKDVVQAILGASLGQGRPVMHLERFTADSKETSCSVPLIEMEIPKGVFVIAQVPPPNGTSDKMLVVKGLPACPSGTVR